MPRRAAIVRSGSQCYPRKSNSSSESLFVASRASAVLSNPTIGSSVLAVTLCDDANQLELSRVCFGNHFGLPADAVSNGVGDVDETIIDAIGVHVKDLVIRERAAAAQ
jgi:hypothetical protein